MAPSRTQVGGRYWRIPPGVYEPLEAEFGFTFDPCPFPATFDGLEIPWGHSNFVNPPFHQSDGIRGRGPTAFVRKAIKEASQGRGSFLTLPTQSYVNLLLEAGAIPRSLGRIKWLEVNTNEPMPGPSPITGFWLPGREP